MSGPLDLDYSLIFRVAGNAMAFTEFEGGRILDVNEAWIRATGIQAAQARGRTALELGLWANAFEREACVTQIVRFGVMAQTEVRLVMRGIVRPYEISGRTVFSDDARYILWEFRDLTELRRSEAELEAHRTRLQELVEERTAALAARERQLEMILQAVPGVVGYWDRDTVFRFGNRAYREWLGVGAEQLVGRNMQEIFGERIFALNRPFAEAALRGEAQVFERRYPHATDPTGSRWARVHYVPDRAGDEVAGFFVMAFDIDDLYRAREQAEAANIAKSSFLANMSHEIRTPLNAIAGMAHLVRRDGVTPAQAGRLDRIDAAGRHLLGIVNSILDLSKIEAGKLVLEEVDVDPAGILASVLSMLGTQAQEKGLELRAETPPGDLRLRGDATRLCQALLNFADNAIKFTAAGTVTLRWWVQDEAPGDVLLRFEVTDTGPGIAPEVLARLFAKFEQGDNTTSRRHGGTGLGLAITKGLAALMGGETGARSSPGEGSTFWFSARLAKAAGAPALTPRPAQLDPGQIRARLAGAHVLLVEDEPVNREITIELLADAGLSPDIAMDGLQAVALAARTPYDLILMDMQLPHMDGLEATRRIRAAGSRAPIIALTADAFAEDRAACLAAGMDDFIAKPVDPRLLLATMVGWLPDRGS